MPCLYPYKTYLLKVVPTLPAGNTGISCLGNSPVSASKKATISAISDLGRS